jgi:2-phospho-L-lactate guanylyltransferase (CobY/MobA/RfbA family)
MHGRPTLLVFSRGASAESARRRLLPGRIRHLEDEAHRELLEAALDAGRDAGCALAISSPRPVDRLEIEHLPQTGADFGARLENAVDLAFARGPEVLLVAAADVPGLTSEHIGQAVASLREDPERVVLGPSPDGGLYLIAMARPIPGLADAARWCRRATRRELERSLRLAGREVVRLAPLADLDRPADLAGWLKRGTAGSIPLRLARLAGILRRALVALLPGAPLDLGRVLAGVAPRSVGRAPPAVSPYSR